MDDAQDLLIRLRRRYAGLDGVDLLRPMIEREFPGRIAIVSSFGIESAVLLALAAEIDRSVPVLFLDTGKHFGETLRYRDQLARRLGLRDLRVVRPDPADLRAGDCDGRLWSRIPDACCAIRKTSPLEAALAGFQAWTTGRKRFHGGLRRALATLEAARGRIKINPLATWTSAQIQDAFDVRDLPRHPLQADGYRSVGCMPCTARTRPGDDLRTGRWPGHAKTECGIHLPLPERPTS